MKREQIMDFLNEDDQKSLEDYEFITTQQQLHVGDYIKYLTKSNYKFHNSGILIGVDEFPVLRVMNRGVFYRIDFDRIYLFTKRVSRTRRDFYQDLLKKLDGMKSNARQVSFSSPS
jgi:hypothetical protein